MHLYLRRAALLGLLFVFVAAALVLCSDTTRVVIVAAEPAANGQSGGQPRQQLDPAAWGSDHVDELLPEYVDSGECLFCHRNDVGESWQTNRHSNTIYDIPADSPAMQALRGLPDGGPLAAEVQLLLGRTHATRFLRRSDAFGKFDLLTAVSVPGRGRRHQMLHAENPRWDTEVFANRCAGCHTTGVDPETQAFMSASLDCYVCHGDAPLEHANDAKLMPLARARQDSPAVVTSICAQCHIRFGTSKSSGLPYPNNFVAGDNLFRDFQFDWSLADDPQLNPGDRHVLDNIREVALYGNEQMTCLSCHEVHAGTTLKHRQLPDQVYCQHCHEPGQDKKQHKKYEVRSVLCGY